MVCGLAFNFLISVQPPLTSKASRNGEQATLPTVLLEVMLIRYVACICLPTAVLGHEEKHGLCLVKMPTC